MAREDQQAALEYLSWGLIPLPCRRKTKHPLLPWTPYQGLKKATGSDVRDWFSGTERLNIWLLCGPQSGIIVVDVDTLDTLMWLRRLTGSDLKHVPRVRTRDGWHLYFAYADGTEQWSYKGTLVGQNIGIDVRNGEKGGVLAPPSEHDETDHIYTWELRPAVPPGGRPTWPELPAALYTRVAAGLSPEGVPRAGTSGRSQLATLLRNPPAEGERNNWLTQVAGHLAKLHRNHQDAYDAQFDQAAATAGLPAEEAEKTRESIWKKEANKPPEQVTVPAGDRPELPNPSDPTGVARALLATEWTGQDSLPLLRSWRDDFYTWTVDSWTAQAHNIIRARVRDLTEHAEYLEHNPKTDTWEPKRWLPNNHKLANVVTALEDVNVVLPAVSPPTWLEGETQDDLVPVHNGLLCYPSRKLLPHTPAYFNLVASPFEYDRHAPPPTRWLRFMQDLWPDDRESVELLQEWFGLMLTAVWKYQKILLLTGPKRAGKGTIIRVLTALVGPDNVASPTASAFAQNFGLMSLLGKSLAVVPDARISGRDALVLVERLLSISGGDELDIDRKNKTPWHGRLSTRLVVVSNEFPRLPDSSGALANRYLPLQLHTTWLGREDLDLGDRLLGELPGILNWALDGLDRLTARGRFVLPRTSLRAIEDLETLSSPTLAFVRDWCEIAPGHEVEVSRLYGKWALWCAQNGMKPTTSQVFGRDLRAAVQGLGDGQRADRGKRYRVYVGIALTKDAEKEHGNVRATQTMLS